MKKNQALVRMFVFCICLLTTCTASSRVYRIDFGGTYGFTYLPNSANVHLGDTVQWIGDFTTYPLQSTSVPPGAVPIGPVSTGDTFRYVIKIIGEYDYQNNIHASIGMKGSLFVTNQLYGLTNEGREFYLGMLYPSYNTVASAQQLVGFNVYALISTHYENDVFVTYYDQAGKENTPLTYHISADNSLKLSLDYPKMQIDTASDIPAYKACHIKSKYPITIYYLSVGASAGGSYLALPLLALGKKYVAASYNDNPGIGALYNPSSSGYLPTTFEYAGGEFLVIATSDETIVQITPTTTTVTGHPGSYTGSPQPYVIQLNKGQCYLVRSNGRNEDNDISGSLIEASKPVGVISGHEDAFIGGVSGYNLDARDFMIEQMVPVEYWDSAGYVSAPLAQTTPAGTDGDGDAYRLYVFDSSHVDAHIDVQGISGGYDMSSQRLKPPVAKTEITAPVDAYSTNGKKICLMQYDERNQAKSGNPSPTPSMMTIVPISRWKNSYSFQTPTDKTFNISLLTYINILSTDFSKINVSINGNAPVPVSSLSRVASFNSISNHYPALKCNIYKFSFTGTGNSYYLSSPDPFMAYYYGFRNYDFQGDHIGDPGGLSYFDEYAAPAGMQLNTGVTPSFIVDTTSTCNGWHVCVRDTGVNDPGLKAVILIDDIDGVYWQTPARYSNVSFDSLSSDYADGELHPHVHGNDSYCFDVNFGSPLSAASAPLAIVDNLGNAIILRLDRTPSALQLSTAPTTLRPDSIVFPVKKIGDQICTTFVLKNSAAKGGTAITLNSAQLTNKDTAYKVVSITPTLPHSIAAQDSVNIQVCYTAADSSRHRDSLVMRTDCFSIAVSLDAHGSTGLISASDLDFGSITVGDTLCKYLQIKNVGSAPFTVAKSFILSDNINFTVDTSTLPILIQPNGSIQLSICFHPTQEGSMTAGIDWSTDLESSLAHSIKSHSALSGTAIPKEGVKTLTSENFTIHPNPATGNSISVTFPSQEKASLVMFDVLGRAVYRSDIISGTTRTEISLRGLSEGVYYLQLNSESGSEMKRVVKVK